MRGSLSKDVDKQLENFGSNILDLINKRFDKLEKGGTSHLYAEEYDDVDDSSLSAPHQVPGRLPSDKGRLSTPLSTLPQGSDSQGATRDGPVLDENVNPPPRRSASSLEDLLADGVISRLVYQQLLGRVSDVGVAPSGGSGSGAPSSLLARGCQGLRVQVRLRGRQVSVPFVQ